MVVVLPAPFGPTNAKRLPAGHLKIQAIDGVQASEPPREINRFDDCRHGFYPVAADGSGPVRANRCEDVLKRQTRAPRFDDEPLGFVIEHALPGRRRRGRRGRHDRPDAGAHDEQSALDQRGDDFVRRVRIDLQILAQRANRGKRSPGCSSPLTMARVTA